MDGESTRALCAAVMWSGLTAAERTKLKTPAGLLPAADDLLKRSQQLGSPYAGDSGDVVLLSPACASFDMFDNYEHRGNVFKELVGEMTPYAGAGAPLH